MNKSLQKISVKELPFTETIWTVNPGEFSVKDDGWQKKTYSMGKDKETYTVLQKKSGSTNFIK